MTAAPLLLVARDASAAWPPIDGFDDNGGYVFGSPGFFGVDFGELDDFRADVDWQYSANGGYFWAPGRVFKVSLGGAFEHHLVGGFDLSPTVLRFLGETRLGGGNEKIWGYGLLGAGLGVIAWRHGCGGKGHRHCGGHKHHKGDDHDHDHNGGADPGFAFQTGGGVQVNVWKGLMVGGELDLDFVFFDGYARGAAGVEAMVGWYF